MLHFISWKIYGISLMVGLILFYGFVAYKHIGLLKAAGQRLAAHVRGGEAAGKEVAAKTVVKGEGLGPTDKGSGAG